MRTIPDTEKNKKSKAWEKAYDRIKDMILTMKIKPGEIVSENNLSKQLGISRTPVREAIKALEQEGLIIASNRRKRVYVLTVKEIEEIFELKKAIESAAVHHFGPIGAIVCEQHLDRPRGDLRTVAMAIAREVGASEADTRAFFNSVSNA